MASSGKFRVKKANKTTFGPLTVDHDPKECTQSVAGKPIHKPQGRALDDKTVIQCADADGVKRDLLVPSTHPIDLLAMLPLSEFKQLQQRSHVVPLSEKIRLIQEANEQKHQQQMESQARKNALMKAELIQKALPGSTLDKIDRNAESKRMYILDRAKDLLTEQEEKVKKANAMILATKVRAIRNVQVAEKQLMKKQLQDEERRLDTMMDQYREKLIVEEEKTNELKRGKQDRYKQAIKDQLRCIEIEKIDEAQRKADEGKMMNKAMIEYQRDEYNRMLELKANQQKMRDDFARSNAEMEKYKQLQQEEKRILDIRVAEFMKSKIEREEAQEREAKLIKSNKEKEITRLRALQEKAQDRLAILDELNALRAQEEKEREWRQHELDEAIKHKEMCEKLREARRQQIEDIREVQARSLAKDREDFKKVAKVQQENFDKEKAAAEDRRMKARLNCKVLLNQMNRKERERIQAVKDKFEEGRAMRLECELRDRNIENYLIRKIDKLKEQKIPEVYIHHIENHLNISK